MGFIINDHNGKIEGGYTNLVDVTTGKILGDVFSSVTREKSREQETLSEYRGIMSGDSIGIYGKQIDSKKGIGNMILEHILERIGNRFEDQGKHLKNVQRYSLAIGKALDLSGFDLKDLALAAKLHDIGKTFIDPDILNKREKLTETEKAEIKKHPEIAYWLLKADKRYRELARYVLHHHERWDGQGYPEGLKEEEIPLFSRIIAVADAFDAMTTERGYQRTISREGALRELIEHSGSQFDPEIVKIFADKVLLKVGNINNELG
ncbi:HD-GYP domain-containing protein [Isachenkonia alkalipeptolytica]|nr:HD-GYP domain-containing protein [Isachenkonia alkalipeptolytica]